MSQDSLFGALVLTVFVALPWAALTLALGTVLYLAGGPASPSSSDGQVTDPRPFGADLDADDG